MPGKDFLALMIQAGFHRVALRRYTGFKSSPYTEGALFYGEKLAAGQPREDTTSQAEPSIAPLTEPACKPGRT
ncbi:MAG TPA: hypothetical protein VFC55_06255 [Desulfobaccales bacterium]|nr:hypothetical protein [Desulfobaccales bacterium]